MADTIIKQEPENLKEVFTSGYAKLFDQQWPMWVGGILFGILNVFMFAYEKAWRVSDGVRNWGNWFFNTIDVSEMIIIEPHLYTTSILNFGIIVGAMASALLARQFQVRGAPAREFVKAMIGGTLMGIGSVLAFGCNIGGFFSAISALSMGGLAMMAGLMIGAFIGLKLLVWEITYLNPVSSPVSRKKSGDLKKNQPLAGILVLLAGIGLAVVYDDLDYSIRGGFLVFGLVIGLIMQRTRFCFVRAFREPFLSGDGSAAKGVAIAVIISAIGFSVLKWSDMKDWEDSVFAGFWIGSLVGGIIFGIGMSLAGGCASGSLWRAGEGHIKLWVALIAFALSGSYFREWMAESGWIMKLGESIFIPDLIGWKMGLLSICVLMLVWYLIVSWNEATKKLVVI